MMESSWINLYEAILMFWPSKFLICLNGKDNKNVWGIVEGSGMSDEES